MKPLLVVQSSITGIEMKRTSWILMVVLAVLSPFRMWAQVPDESWRPLGGVTKVEKLPNGVELRAGRAAVRVVAVTDAIVRVRVTRDGTFPADHSWAVLPEVVQSPLSVRISESPGAVEFTTGGGQVRVQKSPLQLVFLDTSGKVLLSDARPMAFSGDAFRVWKVMPEDAHYYGLGDKPGSVDHRGQAYSMWNTDAYGWQESTDPLYKDIPFFLALRHGVSYGVFLDNTYRSSFDLGRAERNVYSFGAEGGELNYYFFFGPDPKKVLESYLTLIGHIPLPPLWALGFQQSRYSYYPEARVRDVARTFREHKIPCDVIYLDIDYQQGNAPFTVDRQNFPNFEGMIRDLGKEGFKLVLITDLHIKKQAGYRPYDEGVAGDDFVKNPDGSVYVGKVWPGESVFPDFTLERVRRWWGTLYKDFVDMGVAGFWNDMNEPAIFERADKTMPLDVVHRVDWGGTETHRAIHNVYGMQNTRATYEGLLRLRPNERPFVLTRAAYAGAQRYAASWTGDNTSSWNHLRMMTPTLESLGLSGYPLVGADIGGFAGTPPPDLLTRWIEVGTFTPIFRDHTTKGTGDQEPWVHGPEQEAIRRRYIELRYQLLPYIYTSVEETTRTGLPLERPLFLEYPNDERFYEEVDSGFLPEYLFGRDLLIAPKVVEMLDPLQVELPQGIWYDFWTGQKFQGGTDIRLEPLLDMLPVYVRGGAIVPQQPVVQYTGQKPDGPLTLQVYPGGDCRGSLYLDDGVSFAYQKGDYLRVNYTCEMSPGLVRVKISPPQGSFSPWWTQVKLEIFGIAGQPKQVAAGGTPLTGWSYDPAAEQVVATIPNPAKGAEISVDYGVHK
ncbi:MAG TPA: glycoside hydrolase family 31 protein [Terriglobales bacterium]|nr:glycoside hydrolase family 31 protein [Terriglobales bacterium]